MKLDFAMPKQFNFYHISKNVESPKQLLQNFSKGLQPIGNDTADADQKQEGGLYFWANRDNADLHIKYLTGDCEGGRADEVSNKVGEIEFALPEDKLTFPEFRFDIERNIVRAEFVEKYMFKHLDVLNKEESLQQLLPIVQLKEGETLLGFTKETRKYAENKANSKGGECLCLRVLNNGQEETRRPQVGDVENISVWLAEKSPEYKNTYSKFLKRAFTDSEQSSQFGLAFKYCGKENIPVSRISIHEKLDGAKKSCVIYDRDILTKQRQKTQLY